MTLERRQLTRTKVIQPAKILINADGSHSCVVDNLSSQGACVSCAPGLLANFPDHFDLTFDNCHTFWCCEVIWRSRIAGQVGVVWKLS